MTVFLWLGVALMLPVLVILLREDWWFLTGDVRRTPGEVIDHQRRTDDGSEFFSPKVRFTSEDGRVIEITDTYGTTARKPAVGSRLDVVYPVAAPERGRVPHPWIRLFLYGFVLGTLAILLARLSGWL